MIESGLLRAAATGDTEALATAIRQLAQSVYAYHLGMLGDETEADEAMQETFVRLARAVGRFTDDSDPASWVFAIARRVAADLRPTPSAPPDGAPGETDGAAWTRRALRALPLELREVLVFREVMRWDPARIASTLATSPEDVERRIVAAKTELAEGIA